MYLASSVLAQPGRSRVSPVQETGQALVLETGESSVYGCYPKTEEKIHPSPFAIQSQISFPNRTEKCSQRQWKETWNPGKESLNAKGVGGWLSRPLQKPHSKRMLRQVLEGIRNSSRPSSPADSSRSLALIYVLSPTDRVRSGKTVRGEEGHRHQLLPCEVFTSYFTHKETNSESLSNLPKHRVDTPNLR